MDFNEWYKTRDTTYVFTHVSDVHLAQLAYKAAFEAGRESVIANRETFQKLMTFQDYMDSLTLEEYADMQDAQLSSLRALFEAGRESVIANRDTFQKVRAEGVREGMERAAKMLDTNYPLCAKWIRKEIDNER